jgi:hypothetical protein
MGRIAVVADRPRPGKEALLLELTREHLPVLREQGRALRTAQSAHTNPALSKMWERYWDACECVPLATIKECGEMFGGFEPVEA